MALDWHSGNRSVLVDHELSGLVLGLTLTTRPEDVYRALIEATAFGTRSARSAARPTREVRHEHPTKVHAPLAALAPRRNCRGPRMSAIPAEHRDAIARLRAEVAALHAQLTRDQRVIWTAGNVSGRVPGADLFVIKPSGVDYDELDAEAMVVCDLDGNLVEGTPQPSSDTAAHAYV